MHTLAHDLRYALRMMQRNPGTTAIALLALGLGIGANTAVFTVLNGVLLRPLPFPESDRLMLLSNTPPPGPFGHFVGVADSDYLIFHKRNQIFEGVAAFNRAQPSLTGTGEPVVIPAANVTTRFFEVLRIAPVMGSGFRDNVPNQVILGDSIWRSRFHADPHIVGTTIKLDGVGHTVAGVMPPGVNFPYESDLWVHMEVRLQKGNSYMFPVVGRLKAGATTAQAYAEFTSILTALHPPKPGAPPNRNAPVAEVLPLKELLVGDIRGSLRVFAVAVGLVLLIACANVANLLLMRAESRRQEIGVRVALGADRVRLARQLLTESLLLGIFGGVLGTLVALWGVPGLLALAPEGRIPRLSEIHIDLSVLAFAAAASVFTALLFGAAPAIQAVQRSLRDSLVRNGSPSAESSRLRSALVVAEVALAVVLVSGAGLMIKTLWRMHAVDPGFQPQGVLTMTVDVPRAVYGSRSDVQSFHTRVLEQLAGVPGVTAAGGVSSLPLTPWLATGDVQIEGGRFPQNYRLDKLAIGGAYFRSMSIRLLQGRDFSDFDTADSTRVAMVSRSAAATLWPGESPIGKRISEEERPTQKDWFTIVGVVDDVRQGKLTDKPGHALYYPYTQTPVSGWLRHTTFVVRQASPDLRIAPSVRAAIHAIDPNLPIALMSTMEDLVAGSAAERTFQTRLLGIFAGLALVLALIGIYGVAAYAVAMRTREIGIRMALGARSGDVIRMVLGRTLILTAAGLVLGIAGARFATRALETMLFEVKPGDPTTTIGVATILAAAALFAGWFPARRAARVDPLVALRWE